MVVVRAKDVMKVGWYRGVLVWGAGVMGHEGVMELDPYRWFSRV